jgi:Uma2 family endonuclease
MVRLQLDRKQPPLTPEQARDLFMITLPDDTEDAPWMVMGDLQFWSASSFAHSVRIYAHERGLPWYVASMLPIYYRWKTRRRHQLAPDVFVAFVPEHPRSSFDTRVEGTFPPFVLEVVSPSSTARDRKDKRVAHEFLKVQEYALFTPREDRPSTLEGYRLNAAGEFDPWPTDAEGRLWSDVLELYLVVRARMLQAQTRDGQLLLTPEQLADERRSAEAEAARLRREVERLRGERPEESG